MTDSRAAHCLDTSGGLLGVATAAEIRGLGVVIPAGYCVEGGRQRPRARRRQARIPGHCGPAVTLPRHQRGVRPLAIADEAIARRRHHAESPAARAGVLVGDIIVAFDGQPIESPEDLLDLLAGDRVGRAVSR